MTSRTMTMMMAAAAGSAAGRGASLATCDVAGFGRDHSRPLRRSASRRYHVRRDISSFSQGFLASMVRARSSIRGRPVLRRWVTSVGGIMLHL
jgi:hypothetical protein